MKDVLDEVDAIHAPKILKCDVCDNNTKDIILDEETDQSLCTDCYVHRYGVDALMKNYAPLTKRPRLFGDYDNES